MIRPREKKYEYLLYDHWKLRNSEHMVWTFTYGFGPPESGRIVFHLGSSNTSVTLKKNIFFWTLRMEIFSLTIHGDLFLSSILPCTTASVEIYNLKVTPFIFYALCFDPWLKWSPSWYDTLWFFLLILWYFLQKKCSKDNCSRSLRRDNR